MYRYVSSQADGNSRRRLTGRHAPEDLEELFEDHEKFNVFAGVEKNLGQRNLENLGESLDVPELPFVIAAEKIRKMLRRDSHPDGDFRFRQTANSRILDQILQSIRRSCHRLD